MTTNTHCQTSPASTAAFSLPHRFSPTTVRLLRSVVSFCQEELHLPHGAHLLLAVSGGADSCALALILHILTPCLGLTLHALSVDHCLRPEAADEARHAQHVCVSLGIPCVVRQADVPTYASTHGLGLEDAARRLRYAQLEEERCACRAQYIALGHHTHDLAEDILLRLTRGAGWPALGGMVARDEARHLLRPLLATEPMALRGVLKECGFSWCEDHSNADRRFRRNRLRHDVLPRLRAENPALDRTLLHVWRLARLDADYWDSQLDAALAVCPWHDDGTSLLLPASLLHSLMPAARLRLYLRAVRYLLSRRIGTTSHVGQARAHTLLALDAALRQGRGNTRFQLPGGMEAHLARHTVRFCWPETMPGVT